MGKLTQNVLQFARTAAQSLKSRRTSYSDQTMDSCRTKGNTTNDQDDVDIEEQSLGEEAYAPLMNGSKTTYQATENNHDDLHSSMSTVATVASFSEGYSDYIESNLGILFAALNLLLYFALAIFAYSYWFEQWSVIDSLYFAVCTFTTIGFGDLYPTNDESRLFTAFFAVYGISILGFFIGLLGQQLVERYEDAMKTVEERAQSRATQMFEGQTKEVSPEASVISAILDVVVKEAPLVAGILTVALVIGHFQGWSIGSSIYFGIITSTTVGFGDLSITGQMSRAVCIVALPLMVAIFCEVLSRIAGAYITYRTQQQETKFLNRQLTPQDLIHMDVNKDGEVEWAEFLVFMLQAMQKVDSEDIEQVRELFHKLDTSGDGLLTMEDLRLTAEPTVRIQNLTH